MRIAFITSEFVTEEDSFDGGLSNYIFKTASGLLTLGHHPIVIVSANENSNFKYKGIDVYRVKPEPSFFYKVADKLSMFKFQLTLDLLLQSYYVNKKLKALNREIPIDIVQFPSYQAIGFFMPRSIKSVMRISGYQKLADTANGLYLKTIRQRQMQILENKTYRKSRNIFGPSEFLAKIISKEFNKHVEIIESPYVKENLKIDHSLINQIQKITNGKKYGLFYGRLAQLKGLIEIAEVLSPFFEKNPDYYFVIIGKDVGYNNKLSLDYILDRVGPNKDRLIYFEEQKHAKLMPVIKQADFVVMPSRVENFPNTCVEAMAFNKIVIATRGISFEQLIEDGVNGFLCEKANSDDLSNIIQNVVNLSSDKRTEIELNAGKTVERLNPDVTVKRLIEYYQSILKT